MRGAEKAFFKVLARKDTFYLVGQFLELGQGRQGKLFALRMEAFEMSNMGIGAVIGLLAIAACCVVPLLLRRRRERRFAEARKLFQIRREWLEARFLTLASQSGKPRGLAWVNCDFDDDVAFARDRSSGCLRALVGITISFEAIEDGGMEDVEAVGNLRAATAVFRFDGTQWETDGRAVFNLNPHETIQHYQHELDELKGEAL